MVFSTINHPCLASIDGPKDHQGSRQLYDLLVQAEISSRAPQRWMFSPWQPLVNVYIFLWKIRPLLMRKLNNYNWQFSVAKLLVTRGQPCIWKKGEILKRRNGFNIAKLPTECHGSWKKGEIFLQPKYSGQSMTIISLDSRYDVYVYIYTYT